jgi:hypothetical protein
MAFLGVNQSIVNGKIRESMDFMNWIVRKND